MSVPFLADNKHEMYFGKSSRASIFFIIWLAIYFLTFNFSPYIRAIVGYPLISFFPALLFILCIQRKSIDLGKALIWAIIFGPVISAIIGVTGLLLGLNVEQAAYAILSVTLVFVIISVARKQEWTLPRPDRQLLFLSLFTVILLLLIYVPLNKSVQMRMSYDGHFHVSVIYQIIHHGVPPEDPLFPGGKLHHYWFYHAWAAVITQFLQRPPTDSLVLINFHALASVIVGVFAASMELYRRINARIIALLFSVLGLNALGWLSLLVYTAQGGTVSYLEEPGPFYVMRHMVIAGDQKLAHSLTKFLHAQAFPLGMSLYVASMYSVLLVLKKGPKGLALFSLTLAVLGAFLFHPTSGLGIAAALGGGVALLMITSFRELKSSILWIVITSSAGAMLSLPYLLYIFPFKTERVATRLWAVDFWHPLVPYLLMIPFILWGMSYLHRSKAPGTKFLLGVLLGTFVAAEFLVLPGPALNKYKFIWLLVIPAGLVGGAAFEKEGPSLPRKVLLGVFLASITVNTAILEYAYLTSSWTRSHILSTKGTDIELSDTFRGEVKLYRWLREQTPEDTIIIDGLVSLGSTICSQRSVIPLYKDMHSVGHPEAEARREMVNRIYSDKPFRAGDLEILRSFNRPVYFLVNTVLENTKNLPEKFDSNPEFFKLRYSGPDYKVYYLIGSGKD